MYGCLKNKGALLVSMILIIALSAISYPIHADNIDTIVDLWDQVEEPAAVELKPVTIVPGETAFLVLDIQQGVCNSQRRPRCVESVPKIKIFLEKARANGITIVYSLTSSGTPSDILTDVAPHTNEPIVKSSVDKFYNTELESILQQKGIKTVIIAGTTAEGAVLHTATGAAIRGFQVVVPVDGMSAGTLYAEQYTAWHLVNAPGSRRRTTLTSFHLIGF